jgi:hypothetical protein
VGFPEIGSDATNKAYVDQRFLDTPIPWGLITGDDKPRFEFDPEAATLGQNVSRSTLVPESFMTTLGAADKRWRVFADSLSMPNFSVFPAFISVHGYEIENVGDLVYSGDAADKEYVDKVIPRITYDFAQEGDTEKVNISDAILSMKSNRITDLAEPVLDSDAATKGRVDAAVTYTQGIVGDVLQTINNLQEQVNNLMNSAALEIPSTSYFELSYTNTLVQIYRASSIITRLYTNQNTVYTNLRLVLKIIKEDGNLNKEVVFHASQPQVISGAHNFTQKYSFNTFDIIVTYPAPALLNIDLMCDIYATGGARPTVLKSYVYNNKNQTSTRNYIGF